MKWKKGIIIGFVIADVLAVNAGVGWLLYKFTAAAYQPAVEVKNIDQEMPFTIADECGEKCRQYIDAKMAESAGTSAQPIVTVTAVPTEKPAVKTSVPTSAPKYRSVQYVTIPGSGSTISNVWENLGGTEFYFDKADYPGLVTVYFEANMKLFNGNGKAFVQLYDSTHGVGVQGSDVQTSNQANTLVTSGEVTFWAGKNLIRVQARSLTADTAIFNSGRLRLILEN